MSALDFLAIGDITTDAFIRLKDAEVHCTVDKEKCQLCMDFGTKIPYEFVEVVPAVGNSPNAAVAAARLGLRAGLLSNIGNDDNGKDCLARLKEEKVATEFVRTHEGKRTNYHYVLWYGDERTILIKHEEFDYELPDIGAPRFVYLSSLGEAGLSLHQKLAEHLMKHPDIKLAFQPGTFQIQAGHEKLKAMYERTYVFFANVAEAQKILATKESGVPALLSKLHEKGPEIAVITDGKRGAYMRYENENFFMPPYPDSAPPYDRTGAGDAFASTFVASLALGKTPLEALRWAPINSMSVVQQVGAQKGLLSRKKIEELLKKAPADYKPE
ncbi:MAG: carbohydrate kinase family protein, partial [bacterium]|nr:carbohydrate kinase family protein [bacterium]